MPVNYSVVNIDSTVLRSSTVAQGFIPTLKSEKLFGALCQNGQHFHY